MDIRLQERRKMMGCRYHGNEEGHYESYFLRANHPNEPKAFWIRYTIFSPKKHPNKAIGELWSIYFDGEQNKIVAAKKEVPFSDCEFKRQMMSARIGGATLEEGELEGDAQSGGHSIAWDLQYSGDHYPLYLLPENLYEASFPKAKAVVGNPNVVFNGRLTVDGETIPIDNWQGSENHNWGSKHTDTYAWGQVAGFDNAPDAFFEAISARLKIGPVWSPTMTSMVLRYNEREYPLNQLSGALTAKGKWDFFEWEFGNRTNSYEISGWICARHDQFVGLNYYNPPKGSHTCLNCKIAECEITLKEGRKDPVKLYTKNRAAFEILTDLKSHRVPVVA